MSGLSTKKLAASVKGSSTEGVRLSRTHRAANSVMSGYTPTPVRLQTKLTVNTPGDKYEQEADRVAEQVMRMPEPTLQRKCATCGSPSTSGGECPECKKKQALGGKLQRRAGSVDAASGVTAPPIVSQVLSSPGSPLSDDTRGFMESRFGHEFSQVRIHTDAHAQDSAQAVSARAYTVGRHIIFGRGEHPTADRRLLAHELTHVLQQGDTTERHVQRQPNPPKKLSDMTSAELQQEHQLVKQRLDKPKNEQERLTDEKTLQEIRDQLAQRGVFDFCVGNGCVIGKTKSSRSVNAFFFAGTSSERALVVGGMHGSELSAIEVAELLVVDLKKAPTKPHYSVVVIPVLFPDNRVVAENEWNRTKDSPQNRNRGAGRYTKGKDETKVNDPNRLNQAAGTPFDPSKPISSAGVPLEPENVMLENVINHFKPTRVAMLHSIQDARIGGFYADPRTGSTERRRASTRTNNWRWGCSIKQKKKGLRFQGIAQTTG